VKPCSNSSGCFARSGTSAESTGPGSTGPIDLTPGPSPGLGGRGLWVEDFAKRLAREGGFTCGHLLRRPDPAERVGTREAALRRRAIDAAFRLYRRHFLTFLGIVALLQVPMTIVQAAVQLAARQPVPEPGYAHALVVTPLQAPPQALPSEVQAVRAELERQQAVLDLPSARRSPASA